MALFTKTAVNSIAGGATSDLIIVSDPDDVFIGTIDGGAGFDELRFTFTGAEYLILGPNVINIEAVVIGTGTAAAAVTSGTSAEAVDASMVGNALSLTGNAGGNEIVGTMFADTIIGGLGQDVLYGGEGNDFFIINSAAEHGANEVIDGEDDVDTLIFASVTNNETLVLSAGTDVERILIGTAAGVTTGMTNLNVNASANGSVIGVAITGNSGANAITGSAYGDVLNGGAGVDTLNGGAGADRFVILALADYMAGESINGGAGSDTIVFTSATAGQVLVLNAATSGVERVQIANALGNSAGTTALGVDAHSVATGLAIYGNNGANVIIGTAGVDALYGLGGDDVFVITSGAHHAAGEVIDGGTLSNNHGNDEIRFASTLAGDTLVVATVGEIERIVIGSGTGAAAVTTGTLQLNVVLSDGNAYGAIVIGNAGGNSLTGNGFENTLSGGAGNDTLKGGGAADVYLYASATDFGTGEVIDDTGASGFDVIRFTAASGVLTLSAAVSGVEQIVLVGATATAAIGVNAAAVVLAADQYMTINGNAGNNSIVGTNGADDIFGGLGKDTLNGGGGNDRFIAQTVAEAAGDTFIGGPGDDRLIIGTGGVLTLSAATTGIETIQAENAGVNAAALTGGVWITGAPTANTITGGSGNDTIDSLSGQDFLFGGAGNDTFVFKVTGSIGSIVSGTDPDSLNGGAGYDTVLIMGYDGEDQVQWQLQPWIVGIEAVTLEGTANTPFYGSAGTVALLITGNGGNNTIAGSLSADTINAGGGDDLILIGGADTADGEVIDGGSGVDSILYTPSTAMETLMLSGLSGVESIVMQYFAGDPSAPSSWNDVDASASTNSLAIQGNNQANGINGSRFADSIEGGTGEDSLVGGAGNDTLSGGEDSDVVVGGSGDDRLFGFEGDDILSGGAGNDTFLNFNAGDLILGGRGTDRIELIGSEQTLDLEAVSNDAISSVEVIDITGDGDNSLNLATADVLAMVGAGGTLTVDGNAGDALSSSEDWGDPVGPASGGYYTYTLGGVSIKVDEDILAFS